MARRYLEVQRIYQPECNRKITEEEECIKAGHYIRETLRARLLGAAPIPSMSHMAVGIAIMRMMLSSVTQKYMGLKTWVWLSGHHRMLLSSGRGAARISDKDLEHIKSFNFGPMKYNTTLNQVLGRSNSIITDIVIKHFDTEPTPRIEERNPAGCTMISGKRRKEAHPLSSARAPPTYDGEGDGFQVNILPIEDGVVRLELEEFGFGMLVMATIVDFEDFDEFDDMKQLILSMSDSMKDSIIISVAFQV